MKFGLVAVVGGWKHVVNGPMIIPMRCSEQSRRQEGAGSSLRGFQESPWRVSRSSFHPQGESGSPKKPFDKFDQGTPS